MINGFPDGLYTFRILKITQDNKIKIMPTRFNKLVFESKWNEFEDCIPTVADITNLEKDNLRDLTIFKRPIRTQHIVPPNWYKYLENHRSMLQNAKIYNVPSTDSLYYFGTDPFTDPGFNDTIILPESDGSATIDGTIYYQQRNNNKFALLTYIPNPQDSVKYQPVNWDADIENAKSCIIIYPEATVKKRKLLYVLFDYVSFLKLCKYPLIWKKENPTTSYPLANKNKCKILMGENNTEIQPHIFLMNNSYEIGLFIKDIYSNETVIYKIHFIKRINKAGIERHVLHVMDIDRKIYASAFNLN